MQHRSQAGQLAAVAYEVIADDVAGGTYCGHGGRARQHQLPCGQHTVCRIIAQCIDTQCEIVHLQLLIAIVIDKGNVVAFADFAVG